MSPESQEKPPKAPLDFSHLGGKKVGHPVPLRMEKEIDFSAIGGKVIRTASEHPLVKADVAESAQSKDSEKAGNCTTRG